MGIDEIINKIRKDAIKYGDNLLYETIEEAEGIIAEAEHEAAGIKKRVTEDAYTRASELVQGRQSAAELEARKMRLEVKQKAVTYLINAAVDELADMKQEDYISLLVDEVKKTGIKTGEILLNEKDRETIGKKLIGDVNKSVKDSELRLSDQTIDSKGGFVLRTGSIEINSSLETMVDSIKESVVPQLVKMVFGE